MAGAHRVLTGALLPMAYREREFNELVAAPAATAAAGSAVAMYPPRA